MQATPLAQNPGPDYQPGGKDGLGGVTISRDASKRLRLSVVKSMYRPQGGLVVVDDLGVLGLGRLPGGADLRTRDTFELHIELIIAEIEEDPPEGLKPGELSDFLESIRRGDFDVHFFAPPGTRWDEAAIREAMKSRIGSGKVIFQEAT